MKAVNHISIIGLEIHVELSTQSKMFCDCPADWFRKRPNTYTCPVCLGLPGALPVPNRRAIEWSIRLAQSLDCSINKVSKFDRKQYFYPDLPKGYQISQYDQPIGENGNYALLNKKLQLTKNIRIRRVHLEEDTGRLIHKDRDTLVDFNRSGVPLVEIVTEPDFDNSNQIKQFLVELQNHVRYLKISDADMEKGSMRLEPNISVKKTSDKNNNLPPYKVEIKNINSFKFVQRGVDYEIQRQITILEDGKTPVQETRGYNEKSGETVSQRIKETEQDYRYFPEPDIPPIVFTDGDIDDIADKIPELPRTKLIKYVKDLHIPYDIAKILVNKARLINIYDYLLCNGSKYASYNFIAKYLVNTKINPEKSKEKLLDDLIKVYKLKQEIKGVFNQSDALKRVVESNPKPVRDYNSGKENAIMFLVGQVMKEVKGKADPEVIRSELIKIIRSRG